MNSKHQLVKNSFSGIVQTLVRMILAIVSIPVFIRILGAESYGVFALLGVVGNLNTFANLGVQSSLVKFLAEQGKCEESDRDIVAAFLIVLAVVTPITIVGFLIEDTMLFGLLRVPVIYSHPAHWLYVSLLFANFFLLLGQNLTSILDAQQKIYITNTLQTVYNVAYWGAILLMLILGYGLVAVGPAVFFATLLWFALVAVAAIRSWGKFRVIWKNSLLRASIKKQLAYSMQIYSSGILGFFFEPVSKILLSRFAGVADVGFFDIALRLKGYFVSFISKILYPLYPFVSESQDLKRIRLFVHDLEQKTFYLTIPLVSCLIVVARPFVSLWIGQNVSVIADSMIAIVSGYLLGSVTVLPMYYYLTAKNNADKTVIVQALNVLVNTVVFLGCYRWFGYYALLLSNVSAIGSTFVLMLHYQRRYFNSSIFDSFKQFAAMCLVFLLDLAGGLLLSSLVESAVARLIAEPIIVALLTIFLYRQFNMVKKDDVRRYLGGEGNVLGRVGARILCKA